HRHWLAVDVVRLVPPRPTDRRKDLVVVGRKAGRLEHADGRDIAGGGEAELERADDLVLAGALDLGLRHVVGRDLLLARHARAFEHRRRHVLRRRGRWRWRWRRRRVAHAAHDATLDATFFD